MKFIKTAAVFAALLCMVCALAACAPAQENGGEESSLPGTPEEIAAFLDSAKAAEQRDFLASVVCRTDAESFNGVYDPAVLYGFISDNIGGTADCGEWDESGEHFYLPKKEADRLMLRFFGVTEYDMPENYDKKRDCFVYGFPGDFFRQKIASADLYEQSGGSVTYIITYYFSIEDSDCYSASLVTFDICRDGDELYLLTASCKAPLKYYGIPEAAKASLSKNGLALSVDEMTEIAGEYLCPLQPVLEKAFFVPQDLAGYILIEEGAWCAYGMSLKNGDINTFYGKDCIKSPSEKTLSAQPIDEALKKYLGLSEEELPSFGYYGDEEEKNYENPGAEYEYGCVMVPFAAGKRSETELQIYCYKFSAVLSSGKTAREFYSECTKNGEAIGKPVVRIIIDISEDGWKCRSVIPESISENASPKQAITLAVEKHINSELLGAESELFGVLSSAGITARATDIVVDESLGGFTCRICFSSEKGEYYIPARGCVAYDFEYYPGSSLCVRVNGLFSASVLDPKTLGIVCGKEILLLNTEDMTAFPATVEASSAIGEGFFASGMAKTKNGYVFLCTDLEENKITETDLNFKKTGEVLSYEKFWCQPDYRMPVLPLYYSGLSVEYYGKNEVIAVSERPRIRINAKTGDSYYLDGTLLIAGDSMYNSGYDAFRIKNGAAVIEMRQYAIGANEEKIRRFAVERKNGVSSDWFELKYENFRSCFDSDDCTVTYDKEKRQLIAVNPAPPAYCFTVDFANKTFSGGFGEITKDMLELIEKSPDGKYALYSGGYYGGGDIVLYSLFVEDCASGKIRYFAESGGMYGGYCFAGFLKNDDIYRMGLDFLEIYNPNTLERIFDINKNLPLGYVEENNSARLLYTFRRDPQKLDFIIIYSECAPIIYDEGEMPNYLVGFLDSDGRLSESCDTGLPVQSNNFGYDEVTLKLKDGKLYITALGRKGGVDASGVFDLSTRKFKLD